MLILAERLTRADPPVSEYAVELVEGVDAHRAEIDKLIGAAARGWTVDRMPVVDRNVLRIGAYELLWRDDVPDKVAIDEAVELAKALSTEESPAFVNGVLGWLLDRKDEQPAPQPELSPSPPPDGPPRTARPTR